MANPTGKNGREQKPWADAIKRALARRELTGDGRDLNKLADTLIDKAAGGDMPALKEIGDRLDGKAAQSMTLAGDPDAPLVTRIERTIVDANDPNAASV